MTAFRRSFVVVITLCAAQAVMLGGTINLNTTLTPVTSTFDTGSGSFTGIFDTDANTLAFTLNWANLSSSFTNAHIHLAPEPGGNGPVLIPFFPPSANVTFSPTPPALPLGTSGTLTETITIVNPTTLDQFMEGLGTGRLYVNVHTTNVPGGEIRGNLPAVPEPGTLLLFSSGLGVAAVLRLRRRLP